MDHHKAVGKQRTRRAYRVRKRTRGTPERPRLCVTRTLRNISAQVIDDISGVTLASASTVDKTLAKQIKYGGNAAAAALVGGESGMFRPWPVQVSRSRGGAGQCGPRGGIAVLIFSSGACSAPLQIVGEYQACLPVAEANIREIKTTRLARAS
jgi:large subunit ribosomal protein L18